MEIKDVEIAIIDTDSIMDKANDLRNWAIKKTEEVCVINRQIYDRYGPNMYLSRDPRVIKAWRVYNENEETINELTQLTVFIDKILQRR